MRKFALLAIFCLVPLSAMAAPSEEDRLFAQLKAADSAETAKPIEEKLTELFRVSGSPSVDLLMSRAGTALSQTDNGTARALEAVTPIRKVGAGSGQTNRGRGPRSAGSAQADRSQEEVAILRTPSGTVMRQARVGEGLKPEPRDPAQAGHGFHRVGVDGGVETAGQDRSVGQPGQRGAPGGTHYRRLEDGPTARCVGLRKQLGQGRGGRLVVGREG